MFIAMMVLLILLRFYIELPEYVYEVPRAANEMVNDSVYLTLKVYHILR